MLLFISTIIEFQNFAMNKQFRYFLSFLQQNKTLLKGRGFYQLSTLKEINKPHFQNILGKAVALWDADQYDQAISEYKKILNELGTGEGSSSQVKSHVLSELATLYRLIGDNTNHLHYIELLQTEIKGFNLSDLGKATEAFQQSTDFKKKEAFSQALEPNNLALSLFTKIFGKDSKQVGVILENQGDINVGLNQLDSAKSNYLEAQKIYQDWGQGDQLINLLYKLSIVEQTLGNIDQAIKISEEIIKIYLECSIRKEGKMILSLYINISDLYLKGNDVSKSIEVLKKCQAVLSGMNASQVLIADIHISLSRNYQFMGDYKQSIQEAKSAIILLEASKDQNTELLIDCYLSLGNSYNSINDLQNALEYYQKSFDYAIKQFGDKPSETISIILLKIGKLFLKTQQFDIAQEQFERAQAYIKLHFGDFHKDLAQVYNSLAYVYMAKKDKVRSIENYELSAEVCHKAFGSSHSQTIMALQYLAEGYSSFDELKNAIETYHKAIQYLNKCQDWPSLLLTLAIGLAECQVNNNDDKSSMNTLREAIEKYKSINVFPDELYLNLGSIELKTDKQKGKETLVRSLDMLMKNDHQFQGNIIQRLKEYSTLFYEGGFYEESLVAIEECLKILKANQMDATTGLLQLCLIYEKMGKYDLEKQIRSEIGKIIMSSKSA